MYEHAIHASRKRMGMLAEVAVAHAREELAVKEHAAKKARMLYRATLPQLVVCPTVSWRVPKAKPHAIAPTLYTEDNDSEDDVENPTEYMDSFLSKCLCAHSTTNSASHKCACRKATLGVEHERLELGVEKARASAQCILAAVCLRRSM